MKSVGVIGLGTMGGAIARNIVKGGFVVAVYDVNPAAVDALVAEGAVAAARPADVAMGADLVITVLPDGPDVEGVVLGEDGVMAAAREGMVLADLSTVHPDVSRRLAEEGRTRGVRVLDAAMARSAPQARAGTLGLMIGGAAEDLEACRPVFATIATDIRHCGPNGAGSTMKLVNNLLVGVMVTATCEAMLLGVKAGLDPETMLGVFDMTAAKSGALDAAIRPRVLTRDFEPAHFALDLLHKDSRLALELASDVGSPLLIGSIVQQLRTAARAKGRGRWDATAIVTILEELAGVELRATPTADGQA